MKMAFRWYGESDSVTLEYISQIPGMRSIVSSLYDVAPGERWPRERLEAMRAQCQAHGLVFDVVESIPVHEACWRTIARISAAAPLRASAA